MGRIRKALSITSVAVTGGVLGAPVRWESSAEKAAREQAWLMREQNAILAMRHAAPAAPSSDGVDHSVYYFLLLPGHVPWHRAVASDLREHP